MLDIIKKTHFQILYIPELNTYYGRKINIASNYKTIMVEQNDLGIIMKFHSDSLMLCPINNKKNSGSYIQEIWYEYFFR